MNSEEYNGDYERWKAVGVTVGKYQILVPILWRKR